MAWKDNLTLIVRHFINDTEMPYNFDDARIQQAIVIGGLMSSREYDYQQEYIFDIIDLTISPDPTSSETYDAVAIALFTLKASCIISTNQHQNAVKTGLRIRDGDSEIDTTSGLRGYSDLLKIGPCAMYKEMLEKLKNNRIGTMGSAIVSPGTNADYGIWTREYVSSFLDMISPRG